MAQKEKATKKRREHKESQAKHGGGGKVRLTPLEKVLIANGGVAHSLLRKRDLKSGFSMPGSSGKKKGPKPAAKRKLEAAD